MHSAISILRYLAFTLGIVAGVGFCGAALVTGGAVYVPAASGERRVGPLQAWQDRIKDEKAHEEKLRAADAAELAQANARTATRAIPVMARGDDNDGVTRPQRAAFAVPVKLRGMLPQAASFAANDAAGMPHALPTATPWRDRPSF